MPPQDAQPTTTPSAATPAPTFDFSHIPGHVWNGIKSLATTGDISGQPAQTEQMAEETMKGEEAQAQAVADYKNKLFDENPEEFQRQHPMEYLYRKGYRAAHDALVGSAEESMTPEMQQKMHPTLEHLAEAGLGAYGLAKPGKPEPVMKQGEILPEGEELEGLETEGKALDFDHLEGHVENHAKTLAETHDKELVHIRPQDFIDKVGKEGRVYPDTVNFYRQKIRNGEDVGPSSIVYDENGNVTGANGRHRAAAHLQENTERMPVEIWRPKSKIKLSETGKGYHEQAYKTSVPVKVTWFDKPNEPHFDEVKGLNEGHAMARARANWPGATVEKAIPESGKAGASPKQVIEGEGLVYKGELTPGSKVHMFEDRAHPGKTAALHESDDITPENVRNKMNSKLREFGVDR